MRPFLLLPIAFTAGLCTATLLGAEQRFATTDNRVALIELFTSEGCSSCPPAERRFAELRDSPALWREVVPIAFHVNYWDRLGWLDRFATREATQREYAYAAVWDSASVYTPCFVRNGAEWRPRNLDEKVAPEKAGRLVATVTKSRTCRVEFTPPAPAPAEKLEVHVALLGADLSSKVTAGENRGENLRHQFVALAVATHALPRAARSDRAMSVEFELPHAKITDAPRHALAVWVTRPGELRPLQATGGWLDSDHRP
jgi:hypothetical protein